MTKATSALFKNNCRLSVNGSLWIECNGERLFGPGPMELLQRIAESGSISKAAKEMNLSYKKAWTIINRLNAAGKTPLVETSPGGTAGGGSLLSEEALQLIDDYRRLRKAFNDFLKTETTVFNNR